MNFKNIFLGTLFSGTLLFSQNMVGLNINSDDLELEGAFDLSAFVQSASGTTYISTMNYINTDGENLFNAGLNANNTFQGMDGLNLSLGLNIVHLEDYLALPLMAEASFVLPLIETIPTIMVSGQLLYAPPVLSFDKAEDYVEMRAEVAMEVISSVMVYAGYRDIETTYTTNYKNNTITEIYNDSFYGGLKVGF